MTQTTGAIEQRESSRANTYAVYVADDNGWLDGCPDSETVFFGGENIESANGTFVHSAHGGIGPVGHVEVTGYRAAVSLRNILDSSGDWIAPEEINPEGEESRPLYAIRKLF